VAAVQYSGLKSIPVPAGDTFALDVETGQFSVGFRRVSSWDFAWEIGSFFAPTNGALASEARQIGDYPAGAKIGQVAPGSDVSFYRTAPYGLSLLRTVPLDSSRYFAFRFVNSATSTTHYGWIKIGLPQVIFAADTEIIEWAWEDTPDMPITVGDNGGNGGGAPPPPPEAYTCVELTGLPTVTRELNSLAYPGRDCINITMNQPGTTRFFEPLTFSDFYGPWRHLKVSGPAGSQTEWKFEGVDPVQLTPKRHRAQMHSLHLVNTYLNPAETSSDIYLALSTFDDSPPELILENSTYSGYEVETDYFTDKPGLRIEARSGDNVIKTREVALINEATIRVAPNASLAFRNIGPELLNQLGKRAFEFSDATLDVDSGILSLGLPVDPFGFGSTLRFSNGQPGSLKFRNGSSLELYSQYTSLRVDDAPLEFEDSNLTISGAQSLLDSEYLTLKDSHVFVDRGRLSVSKSTQISGDSSVSVLETQNAQLSSLRAEFRNDIDIAASSTLSIKGKVFADATTLNEGVTIMKTGTIKGVAASSRLLVTDHARLDLGGGVALPLVTDTGGTLEVTESATAVIRSVTTVPGTSGPIINNGRLFLNYVNFPDDYTISRRPDSPLGITILQTQFKLGSTLTLENDMQIDGELRLALDPTARTAAKLVVTGELDINELRQPTLQLDISNDTVLPNETRFVLVDYPDGGLSEGGSGDEFTGRPDGTVFVRGLNHYRINYSDPSDPVNSSVITLTAVSADVVAVLGHTINSGANGFPDAGETIDLTITLTNNGSLDADLAVLDMLAPSVVADCGGGDYNVTVPANGGSKVCTAVHTLTQEEIDRGYVINKALVAGTDTDITATERIGLTQVYDIGILVQPIFAAGYTAPTSPGDLVDYFLRFTNIGNMGLGRIDKYLAIAGIESQVIDSNFDGSTPGQLAPGDSFDTVTLQYAVTQADIDNGQIMFDPRAELYTSPSSVKSVDGTSNVLAMDIAPSIAVTTTAVIDTGTDADVDAGDLIHYTITVTNTGNTELYDIKVSDPLLDGLLDCPLQLTLDPDRSLDCTADLPVEQGQIDAGKVENTVTVTATPGAGVAIAPDVVSSDTDKTLIPQNPQLSIATSAQVESGLGGIPRRDDPVKVSFVVTNEGNDTLDKVVLSSPVAQITCPEVSLAVGASMTCTGDTQVHQGDLERGSLIVDSSATASAPGETGGTVSATDRFELALEQVLQMTVSKEGLLNLPEGQVPVAGDTINYAVGVFNSGNVALTSVVVDDPLIANLYCPFDSVAPGFLDICFGDYLVTDADVAAGERDNTAAATAVSVAGNASDSDDFLLVFPLPMEAVAVPVSGPEMRYILILLLALSGLVAISVFGLGRNH
jgi:uncharacterized repeat protein (TIGR01451 family)